MSKATLTESELRVLSLAWHCFETMPKVNTTRLAELGGWKTAASANTAYCSARKKLLAGVATPARDAGSDSAVTTPATPKTTGKKRSATYTPADDGTANKRGRKFKAEKQATSCNEADVDDDETKDAVKIKGEGSGADDVAEEKAEVKDNA